MTRLLSAVGLTLNPPIVRFGEAWEITPDDWIYLSNDVPDAIPTNPLPPRWNADGWFDRIASLELRTEKEVELKFIVPLLARLAYGDDDRYDGMPVRAAQGSLDKTPGRDFADQYRVAVEGSWTGESVRPLRLDPEDQKRTGNRGE
jgi:hypothetical protein